MLSDLPIASGDEGIQIGSCKIAQGGVTRAAHLSSNMRSQYIFTDKVCHLSLSVILGDATALELRVHNPPMKADRELRRVPIWAPRTMPDFG